MKHVGINDAGNFDNQMIAGINDSGDYDQLSLPNVDFGEDYCQDYGVEPMSLESQPTMKGFGMDYNQLGSAYEMGVMPEGLSGDFNQMGIVPEGFSGYYNQMGTIPSGLGHSYHQMGGLMDTLKKPLFTVGGFAITPIILAGAGAALWFAKKQGMLKKIGF